MTLLSRTLSHPNPQVRPPNRDTGTPLGHLTGTPSLRAESVGQPLSVLPQVRAHCPAVPPHCPTHKTLGQEGVTNSRDTTTVPLRALSLLRARVPLSPLRGGPGRDTGARPTPGGIAAPTIHNHQRSELSPRSTARRLPTA